MRRVKRDWQKIDEMLGNIDVVIKQLVRVQQQAAYDRSGQNDYPASAAYYQNWLGSVICDIVELQDALR